MSPLRLAALLITLAAAAPAIEPSEADQLICVKRVFVDKLDGDETALQMRDMILSALQQSHLFVVTENEQRADTILRGSAKDLQFNESHSSSEGVNAHMQASTSGYTYRTNGNNKSLGATVGENESNHSVERRHEASAAIRLVNKEGDVIWSTTQESQGSKFRGSMADVADKITRKLSDDIVKARTARARAPVPPKPK
jgi:hypothetical protein